jgi:hypothetical protein
MPTWSIRWIAICSIVRNPGSPRLQAPAVGPSAMPDSPARPAHAEVPHEWNGVTRELGVSYG